VLFERRGDGEQSGHHLTGNTGATINFTGNIQASNRREHGRQRDGRRTISATKCEQAC